MDKMGTKSGVLIKEGFGIQLSFDMHCAVNSEYESIGTEFLNPWCEYK